MAFKPEEQKTPLYEVLRSQCDLPGEAMELIPEEAKESFSHGMFRYIDNGVHGFWLPPEDGDGHCRPDYFSYSIARRFSELSRLHDLGISSPIEWRLAGELLWADCDWAGLPSVDIYGGPSNWPAEEFRDHGLQFFLTPQARVAGFRVDFLMWFLWDKSASGIAIECDGHQFHEKTKEQASKDKARDRAILAAGFPTVRFSGSDIYNRAGSCAEEAKGILSGILERMRRERG